MGPAKIVILDGATLNPGDNSWSGLEDLGDVEVYGQSSPEEILERCTDATVVVVNKVLLTRDFFSRLPSVKFVAVTATGWDCVDAVAATDHGVVVSNVPVYGTDSVSQFTMALILELCHHVGSHGTAVQAGEWGASKNFSFWKTPLIELTGRTLGVVGFGRIGRRVGELAHAFGMTVLAYSPSRLDAPCYESCAWSGLDELLAASDIISLHCPLTPGTKGLIHRNRLQMFRPHALLINTSRGGLIIEADLAEALNNDWLAAAAVDVVSQEPLQPDNPLLMAKNCLITPHIAWATLAARRRLMSTTVENIANFFAGTPSNVVTNIAARS